MYITILDFSTGITYIKKVPQHLQEEQSDDVIEYFCTELGIREKDTEYIIMSELEVISDVDVTAQV